ncbi:F0F1 ATP synthase subunit delta [Streptococcus panodentis]|uniref:ATP synthase subunit delta n=1 Tax=Streptococcus panodentis TaxID=1581472 RepID=A0ABS5AV48_9STRE|nr:MULTISPECIES: F0F1 ATP synthase subunit delta [Streptococcus]KXT82986.1 ATP synthase delta chain [Streptococcus sp. DD11]MBP2620133.1 F0F1 ATP synthase subunit delta [Streptococcus panodentis]
MDKKQYALVEKYALPFVQVVFEKGQQEDVFEKLSQIKAVFEETGLADFLAHIGVDSSEKEKSLRLFQKSGSELIDNLIEVVILNHREGLFYAILLEVQQRIEKISHVFEVTVKSVQPLTDSQKAKLRPMIEQKMGLKVRSIRQELDSSLIGGFVISADNKMIDASIRSQLQVIKENLK